MYMYMVRAALTPFFTASHSPNRLHYHHEIQAAVSFIPTLLITIVNLPVTMNGLLQESQRGAIVTGIRAGFRFQVQLL